jgi:hypothetical protein
MEEPWLTLLGTFLGALLGVFSGLAVNHAWNRRTEKSRRGQMKVVLRRAIDHNSYLLGIIDDLTQKGRAPTFNVDLPLLESTAALKYELLDVALCQKIDHLRFELSHLARKVDALLELQGNATARATNLDGQSLYSVLHQGLIETIRVHIGPIKTTIAELQSLLPPA